MDTTLTNFISVLRNADIRISPAETLDAFHAVQLVGYRDRTLLKNTLGMVLPKTVDEKAAFSECFDRFFSYRELQDKLQQARRSRAARWYRRSADSALATAGRAARAVALDP